MPKYLIIVIYLDVECGDEPQTRTFCGDDYDVVSGRADDYFGRDERIIAYACFQYNGTDYTKM